ncbi:MAG: 6-carboxytetrahydropterin synthase QueD [Spirochaetes bacterium]|jgi:6-pyruvoyltetrahydropterin/6-carboxytetrahydropterin synthase|nr:6-carboxytetrahydropterin synthase QueD [Spirochaetota bacterium]
MYRIKIYDRFSSAHFLKGYKGECESLHGHNWKVEIEVQGEELDNVGMLMDFKRLKAILHDILVNLDHRLLNDIHPFSESNPSSEIISGYIYKTVKEKLPQGLSIHMVSVWESENSVASYFE